MSSNLENMKTKHWFSLFFFFFWTVSHFPLPPIFFRFLQFNLKYKNKDSVGFFSIFFEAFSLAEIQYKNLQCCGFMSYYQECTTGTCFLCSGYMVILHEGRAAFSHSFFCFFYLGDFQRKRTSYSTFRLLQRFGGFPPISSFSCRMKIFPAALRRLISTSLRFSGTVFHLQQRTHAQIAQISQQLTSC